MSNFFENIDAWWTFNNTLEDYSQNNNAIKNYKKITDQQETTITENDTVLNDEEHIMEFIEMFEKKLAENGYVYDEFTGTWKKSF